MRPAHTCTRTACSPTRRTRHAPTRPTASALRSTCRSRDKAGSTRITPTRTSRPRCVSHATARVRIEDTHAAHRVSCWQVRNGVKMGEGDGTVSLLSLGAMCVEGWKRERWNPGGVRVVTVEVRTLRASSRIFWNRERVHRPAGLSRSSLISRWPRFRAVARTLATTSTSWALRG